MFGFHFMPRDPSECCKLGLRTWHKRWSCERSVGIPPCFLARYVSQTTCMWTWKPTVCGRLCQPHHLLSLIRLADWPIGRAESPRGERFQDAVLRSSSLAAALLPVLRRQTCWTLLVDRGPAHLRTTRPWIFNRPRNAARYVFSSLVFSHHFLFLRRLWTAGSSPTLT